jgi:VIT1/CCC1 family predicted Fe2+/Mn2+ transporter
MSAGDRAYLTREVAAGTGLSPADAATRVDAVMEEMNDAKVKARQVADAARKASSLTAIFTGLAMLIGAFVACVAAALGGQQRDEY